MESNTSSKQVDQNCASNIPDIVIPSHSFSKRMRIDYILNEKLESRQLVKQIVQVSGWCKTLRKQGGGQFCFIALNDGSTNKNLQVIVNESIPNYNEILKCGVGCSFKCVGEIVESPAQGQAVELQISDRDKHSILIYGTADSKHYPLSKKSHSREFLREICHLRPRSYLISAVARIRSNLCMATHRFFQDRGFVYIHTPIITESDCEGAGDLFHVCTSVTENTSKSEKESTKLSEQPNSKNQFFNKPAYLTVSGQLALENFCCSMSDVYSFGPTFRAEKSHTSRHLAEFWMVEPELAFADIYDNMECAEEYIKYCIGWCLKNCQSDLQWLDQNIEKQLIQKLTNIIEKPFIRITYTEAINLLQDPSIKSVFQEQVAWGDDLSSEHEKYLSDTIFKHPVIVYNYPRDLKPFYMRLNNDEKTVAAMDILLPKIGEVIGGSQREERLDYLERAIKYKKMSDSHLWWYLDLRKYGSVPHSGFGLGLERLIMAVTGVDNVKDTIPYPRYPGHADF